MSIFINRKTYTVLCVLAVAIYGCGTAPDNSRRENGWTVVENQCEDLFVEVRTKIDYGSGEGNRRLQMSDIQNRKIYKLEVSSDSTGNSTITSTSYANNVENEITETKRLPRARAIDAALNEAYDNFYEQPGKHKSIDLNCALRGMNYGT